MTCERDEWKKKILLEENDDDDESPCAYIPNLETKSNAGSSGALYTIINNIKGTRY